LKPFLQFIVTVNVISALLGLGKRTGENMWMSIAHMPISAVAHIYTDFYSDNPCHYTMYFLILCRSHQMYRAFAIPWLSQKYTSYANYVLLKNRQLFSHLKLNPLYAQSAA